MILDKLIAFFCAFLGCVAAQSTVSYGYTPAAMPTNTALQGAATITYPGGVTRDTFGNGNGATPLFYMPSNAACALNAGAGDNGSQVRSADGKCWIAQFPMGVVDVLQFGAIKTGSGDNTAIFNAAAAAAGGGIVIVPPGTYNLSATPTYGTSGWQYQPGATTTGAPITSTANYPLASTRILNGQQLGNPNNWMLQYAYGCDARTPLCALSQVGSVGVLGASRNTDNSGGNAAAIGVMGWDFNFNTTAPTGGWGIYTEARRIAGTGPITTIEADVTQLGPGTVDINPYSFFTSGLTAALWLGSGGGCQTSALCYAPGGNLPAYAASTAVGILANGSQFRTGITVEAGALDTTATTFSTGGRFASLPSGAGIEWSYASGSVIGSLSADTTAAGAPSLVWEGNPPIFTLAGKESGARTYAILEDAGTLYFQSRSDNSPSFAFNTGTTTVVAISATAFYSAVGFTAALPTTGAAGGEYVCIDGGGVFYKKTSCP